MKHGLKYFNLFEFLNKKIVEGKYMNGEELLEQEYREALYSLEEDGYINLIGHKKAPTIRFCIE
jgi:DNA-binding GntR family transcriptional regulator